VNATQSGRAALGTDRSENPRRMLLGRAHESARLDALLVSARQGQSGALVIRGEAGIGKTALLDFAESRAEGFRVLRATGIEAESSLAFSGLLQLARPILDSLDEVVSAQAQALRRALGLDLGEADPFLAYSGMLHLLAAASEESPVLCVVDDAHWLDQASAQALTFAARRLEADSVAVLLAVRQGEEGNLDTRGIEGVELGGLDDVAARELLDRNAGSLAPPVASRLIATTGGNPLALVEVPPMLSERQRAGGEPLDDPLPVGESVERAFLMRAEGLSADSRRVLLLAAASDADDLAPVARVAGPAGWALDEAEAAGLIRVRGDRLVFRHPLVRSAIYSSATAGDRRAAHAALADALGEEDADRRAWHLSAAVIGPDAEVAAALDEAAGRAHQRGGLAAEARLLERSATLTPDPGERVPRLLRAGIAAHRAGLSEQAMALLEDGLTLVDEPRVRADLHAARAYVLRAQGRLAECVETCLAEADRVEPFDSLRAANLLSPAEEFVQEQFDMDRARELAGRIGTLLGEHRGRAATTPMAMLTWVDTLDARSDEALRMAWDGARLELERDRLSESAVDFAECLVFLERYSEARQLLEAAVSDFRRRGAVVDLIRALAALVALELRSGSIVRASVAGNEAVQLSVEGGLDYWEAWSLARLASVDAVLGPEAKGRAHAVRSAELASRVRDLESESHAYDALGRLELGLGNAMAAVRALERTAELLEPVRHTNYVLWAPDLVEAYVRAGRLDEALRLNERFGELAARSGTAWAVASAARCRALLAAEEEFGAAFADALRLARADGVSGFERARTELLWGERLRRSGLRIEAREQLRSALDEFDRIGAASWADLAREELRASGETARPRDPSLVDRLTPRELEIAIQAADGLTNKEIGARLFLSPKTVELHLGRVYRKLGVRSRTELVRAIPSP
jgi:DNA-binding CsgD family transcriptional regulator